MTERPSLDQSNEAEWRDRRNWRGPRWLGFYVAPRDSRLMVPKHPRLLGFTLNLGHPSARWFLAGMAAVVVLLIATVLLIERF